MQTYDTHAHLDHLENLDECLSAAEQAGVKGIVAMSMDLESCRKNLEFKQTITNPKIYLGMGMHPSETNLDDLDALVNLIKENSDQLVAVGEIGLDFWYKWVRKDDEKKDEQRKAFRALLSVAKELDLPAVIHSRGAWRECLDITKGLNIVKAEFHWYSGPIDVLDDILDAGYYVSTSPSVASSPQSREAMAHAPIERTMIETDCPVYYRNRETGDGFKAQPKDVFRTLDAYCDLKGLDKQEALNILNRNAEQFFNLK